MPHSYIIEGGRPSVASTHRRSRSNAVLGSRAIIPRSLAWEGSDTVSTRVAPRNVGWTP